MNELKDVSERFNHLFKRDAPRRSELDDMLRVPDWVPSVDITETADEYHIKAELPEVEKEDVSVRVEQGVLTLQGERKEDRERMKHKVHRIECPSGWFVRSFVLPDIIEESKVQATFKDGMLYLRLPKSAHAKPKTIEVKVA
jgi:HSP20 family protein